MSRIDQYSVTVTVEGLGALGVFDKLTGGDVDSDEQKYRPGGMADPVSLGGAVTMTNIVVSRNYVLERDHPNIHKLLASVGRAWIWVVKQPLDIHKVPYGRPLIYQGKIKNVKPPEHDSTSSDPAMLDIEFVPTGTVG
ncbi:MAG: hypothetical protein J2P17_16670 [Mycobacterium sp.]|nr:hypothetical protein [Mycobacterium sp.]